MSFFHLSDDEYLFYLHTHPSEDKPTVVFINALIGQTEMWEGYIGKTLRANGFGTLSYNFRGQVETRFDPLKELSPNLIVDDLIKLLQATTPKRPVLVGLSIGGLFAAQAIQNGVQAAGLVLINTLRKPGLRLDWINESTHRAFKAGGRELLLDLMAPMLFSPGKLAEMRADAFKGERYQITHEKDGHLNLMRNAVFADWDFPWHDLDIPTLVMTGFHDRVFFVNQDVLELSALIPNMKKIDFENAGHMIPIEQPKQFTDELLNFLSTL